MDPRLRGDDEVGSPIIGWIRRAALRGVLLLIGLTALTGAARAEVSPTACSYLEHLVDGEPAFLASYPTVANGPLHGAAFLYDNAAAVVALVGCGRPDLGRRIGDAILAAIDRDRFWHDGRLRNGYAAGPVGSGPIKLAGWWDSGRNQWLEDRYQVGSDSGNMAWAMLALLALDGSGAGREYREGAMRIGDWVSQWLDDRGPGGFSGGTFGHEPAPAVVTWKSTEHNTDLAAAFARLAQVTGQEKWRHRAEVAQAFVRAMWNPACGCFATGTGEDGVTPNPILVLDAQIWPLLALGGAARDYVPALDTVERRLRVDSGFAYGEARDGVWTEGTAQVALCAALTGRDDMARQLNQAITSERAPDGGYYATSAASLPTGFMLPTDPSQPRLYFHLPHLGAAAWAALVERRFNPFTGTSALP